MIKELGNFYEFFFNFFKFSKRKFFELHPRVKWNFEFLGDFLSRLLLNLFFGPLFYPILNLK